jgi:hypothetical protein
LPTVGFGVVKPWNIIEEFSRAASRAECAEWTECRHVLACPVPLPIVNSGSQAIALPDEVDHGLVTGRVVRRDDLSDVWKGRKRGQENGLSLGSMLKAVMCPT